MMTPPEHERRPLTGRTGDHSARVGAVSVRSKQPDADQPVRGYTVSAIGDAPPDLAHRVPHARAQAMIARGSPDRASRAAKKVAKPGWVYGHAQAL